MQHVVFLLGVLWVTAIRGFVPDGWCNEVKTVYHVYDMEQEKCPCHAKNEGTLKYSEGKVSICNGKEWAVMEFEGQHGKQERPGLSCQNILVNNLVGSRRKLSNGIYWIKMKGRLVLLSVHGWGKEMRVARSWGLGVGGSIYWIRMESRSVLLFVHISVDK